MIKNYSIVNKKALILLYLLILLCTIYFGFISGSRMALILPIMAFIYNHQDFFSKRLWIFIILSPFAFFVFASIGLTRALQFEVTLSSLYFYILQNNSILDIGVHILVDRFNYLRAINEVFITYSGSYQVYSDYLQNIYGAVPRLFWPDKPIMGMNLNYIGIEIGVLNPGDKTTSYGLHFIGESFYQLKWLGLTIAFLQGIILAKIDTIRENTSIVSCVLAFQLSVYSIMTGTLLTFIPELIMLIIPNTVLPALLNTSKDEKTFNNF